MLKELVKEKEINDLITYLKTDVQNCLYIYIDLKKYGLSNENIKVWTDGVIEPRTVVMKYHDSFQIYAKEQTPPIEGVLSLIDQYAPERISGNETVIRQLEPSLCNGYKSIYGAIFCQRKNSVAKKIPKRNIMCSLAGYETIPEIVDLLHSEKEFSDQYSKKELMEQFEERYRTGMGRSMIVKENDKIIGHISTFAELDDIAIVSGSVMQKEYRNTDYYSILSESFYDLLCNIEQKDVYYFATNKRHIKYYEKAMGACVTYGKLTKM